MIAEKIKALREARGWSQAELSRRLGITRNGVNSWEQGLSMPSPACLVDLAKVFGVSTDYLLGLERLTTVDVTGLADLSGAKLATLLKLCLALNCTLADILPDGETTELLTRYGQ